MKRASPEMIVTGAVGSYLVGSAWASAMLALMLGMVGVGQSASISLGVGVGLLFVLLWLGGCVCEGIGWIGVARLHGGLAAFIGWVTCTLPATYFVLMMLGAAAQAPAVLVLMGVIQVGLYLSALVFAVQRKDRTVVLPVVFGTGLAILGILGFVMAATVRSTALSLVFFYVGVCGMIIAHFAFATYFRSAARQARALDVFV